MVNFRYGSFLTPAMYSHVVNKLLVIGGTGLLGQYVVLEATGRGWGVTATYHDSGRKAGHR